jgi:hypothetical protein
VFTNKINIPFIEARDYDLRCREHFLQYFRILSSHERNKTNDQLPVLPYNPNKDYGDPEPDPDELNSNEL